MTLPGNMRVLAVYCNILHIFQIIKYGNVTHRFQSPLVDNCKGSMTNEVLGIKLVDANGGMGHLEAVI